MLALGLIVATGAVAYAVVVALDNAAEATKDGGAETTEEATDTTADGAGNGQKETTQVSYSEVLPVINTNDERELVGGSTDVFFGRVIEQVGSEGRPTSKPGYLQPQTQFAVEVLDIIKGDASGAVTVNQKGGYTDDGHEDHKHLQLAEGDELLEPGQEYLFATNHEEGEDWYTIFVAGHGNIRVKDKAEREKLEQRFEKAKANQVEQKIPRKLPANRPDPYKPCRPDGTGPPGCDPSDPPPEAGKVKSQ